MLKYGDGLVRPVPDGFDFPEADRTVLRGEALMGQRVFCAPAKGAHAAAVTAFEVIEGKRHQLAFFLLSATRSSSMAAGLKSSPCLSW